MDDFIFGTLATDEMRLARVRSLRAGVTHNHARMPRDPSPGQPITLDLEIGPGHFLDRAWVYWTTDGLDPIGESGRPSQGKVMPMEPAGEEWDTLLWGYRRRFRAVLPGQPAGTVVRYRLAAASNNREELADGGTFYACFVADDPLPDWARDAIVYQIFVDRFFPGEGRTWGNPDSLAGFYGGTLGGILQKLDYISELGVNALWLSPIFPSPTHHGYDASDIFEIEPRLGSKADLRALIDSAHARGIRLLLDFVPNHFSDRHSTFQEASQDPESPYRNWYNFTHWPDRYEAFFGVRSLPRVNLRYPPARQHMLDAAAYWLEFGVDGYRVDYALGPTPDFWADFRRITRNARPDCWTFGEVVDPPDVQLTFQGGLDGCLDFILLEGIRQTFVFGRWSAAQFTSFLDRHEAYFPGGFSRPSFLDNHDMNRILWAAGSAESPEMAIRRLKLAALCQFTLSGPPVIYYGTEVGLSQQRDVRQNGRGILEESRLPMLWDDEQDADLLDYYRRLIDLRRREPVLRDGTRRTLQAGAHTLAYLRQDGTRELAVALNPSSTSQILELEGSWNSPLLISAPEVSIEKGEDCYRVTLPPLSGVILETR